ncbi:DUF4230 domain-containing protein [Sphingomonas japonica]|uniref:DUF4230 domain-containing protein n=1 Tax=Sphingomonas japonica TaxID=511662 RepID=A0ABX0U289_9SPHN|nr:DUF4230 domain-containing protein [Sphingomonas japonica]NIJ24630.1 hypothetical protein [Sphingomonas japonica]
MILTHLGAVGVGFAAADKRPVDTEVENTGFFQVDTTKVLATTVESLREENKLLVFSYKGTASVRTDRTMLWVFGGRQELIVPAAASYFLDLSDLTLADVSYNDAAKVVTVRLPKITLGDIAFQPEAATTINGGILSWDDDQVEALRKLNYRSARRAMVAQAQQPGLLNAAKRQAVRNVSSYFEIPLRMAGRPDVKVVATFR